MKRYLQFRNFRTGETARQIDVTGKSEREVEKITRGMLINIGDDWLVDDIEERALQSQEPNNVT